MFSVIKRDGIETEFCLDKIGGAVVKAFNATQMEKFMWRIFRTAWRRFWSRRGIQKLPKRSSSTENSGRRCAI